MGVGFNQRAVGRAPLLAALGLAVLLMGVLAFSDGADASHFRGGAITAELTQNANEVEVSGWMAFRTSYPWVNVGSQTPQVGSVMQLDVGKLAYSDNTQSTDDIHLRVVSIDQAEDWFYGEIVDASGNAFTKQFPSPDNAGNAWGMGALSCCRLGGMDGHINNGGTGTGTTPPPNGDAFPFSIILWMDFDTATQNSPDAQVEPIVSCQKGATCGIAPAIIDKDGDNLAFRFSASVEAAANDQRFRQPGHDQSHGTSAMTIDANTGLLTWDTNGVKLATGGNPTFYSVQIHAQDAGMDAPLDFFIKLVDPYVNPPYWTNASPCGDTLKFPATQANQFTVTAESNHAPRQIQVGHLTLPGNSAATIPAKGNPASSTFSWTPTMDDIGFHQVVYRAVDELNQRADPCRMVIEVTIPPPVAGDDAYTFLEDSSTHILQVLSNDADPQGNKAFTITQIGGATKGSVQSVTGNTEIAYTPDADAHGQDCFTYRITTTDGRSDIGQVCVTLTPINDAPSYTVDATILTREDVGTGTVTFAKQLSRGPGETDTLTWTLSASPTGIVQNLQVLADGRLQFTTVANAFGDVSITAQATDDGGTANGGQDTGPEVSTILSVQSVNDRPTFTAGGNFLTLEEGDPPFSGSWATDMSPGPANEQGQTLQWQLTPADPSFFSNGPTLDADGNITFALAPQSGGATTVEVLLVDDGGTDLGGQDRSNAHTLSFDVQPRNDPPTFDHAGDIELLEDGGTVQIPWASNISPGGGADEANQQLTWTVILASEAMFDAPVTISDAGVLTFELADDLFGETELRATLRDNGGTQNNGQDTSEEVRVAVRVLPVNDEPSYKVRDGGASVEATVPAGSQEQRYANWANEIKVGPDNEALQVASFVVTPENPDAFLQVPRVTAAGTLVLTPEPGFYGTTNFTVCVRDDGGTDNGGDDFGPCNPVNLRVYSTNDAPTFQPGENIEVIEDDAAFEATWATAISPGPDDEAWQSVFFILETEDPTLFSQQPTMDGDGVLRFTPRPDASGTTTVLVTLKDNGGTLNGGKDSAPRLELSITIHPRNDAPVAELDTYTLEEDTMLKIPASDGVLRNDFDADGDDLEARLLRAPQNGVLAFEANGSFHYTPNEDYFGGDSFDYEIRDPTGETSSAMVLLTVINVNDEPIGLTDYYRVKPNTVMTHTPLTGILVNDIDLDLEPLRAELIKAPVHGILDLRDDGSFVYTPDTDFVGTDFFVYRALDNNGGSSLGSNVHLRIEDNRPPVANFEYDGHAIVAGTPVQFKDLSSDADGQGISPDDGNARLGQELTMWQWRFGDGTTSVEQHPLHTFENPGTYDVALTVQDTDGASATATQRLTVLDRSIIDRGMNAPVVLTDSHLQVLEGQPIPLHATVQPANAALQWTQIDGPAVTILGATDANPVAIAPYLDGEALSATLSFRVVASGNSTYSEPKDIEVVVLRDAERGRIELPDDHDLFEGQAIRLKATLTGFEYRPTVVWEQRAGPALGIGKVHGETLNVQVPAGSSGESFTFLATATYEDVTRADQITIRIVTPLGEQDVRILDVGERSKRFLGVSGLQHAWSFGDGTTSTEPNPVHAFDEPGDYDVRYEAIDANGRTVVFESTIQVADAADAKETTATPDAAVTESNKGLGTGAIIGIVAGSLVVLAGVGVVVWRIRVR